MVEGSTVGHQQEHHAVRRLVEAAGGGLQRLGVVGEAGAVGLEGHHAVGDDVHAAVRVFLLEVDDVVLVRRTHGVCRCPVRVQAHVLGGVHADVLAAAVVVLVAGQLAVETGDGGKGVARTLFVGEWGRQHERGVGEGKTHHEAVLGVQIIDLNGKDLGKSAVNGHIQHGVRDNRKFSRLLAGFLLSQPCLFRTPLLVLSTATTPCTRLIWKRGVLAPVFPLFFGHGQWDHIESLLSKTDLL